MGPRPGLHLGFGAAPPAVTISRDNAVSEAAWLRLRALFGSEGEVRSGKIVVPAERFLPLTAPLRSICSRYRLRLDVDQGVTTLLQDVRALRDELDRAYAVREPFDESAVSARLSGGRFRRELTSFQRRDLAKLLALPHGANFSVPGAGKTTVAYATYEAERLAKRVSRLVVIGPLSSFDAWTSEAGECFATPPMIGAFSGKIDLRCEVLLANYQRLAGQYDVIAQWIAAAPTHVVLDEAHRMKRGWEGAWGSACLRLAYFAERRDVLTGTPAPQSPEDLLALVDFLWPTVGRYRLPPRTALRSPDPTVVRSVSESIRPLYVRTRKAELGLRDPSFDAIVVPLEGLHREIYDALRDEYAGSFALQRPDRLTMIELGHVVMYLIEAATNPALLVAGSSPADPVIFRHPPLAIPTEGRLVDLLRSFGEYETPRKFKILAEIVDENAAAGRKTLIWTNFVRNIATLNRMLARLEPAVIHGGVPLESDRADERTRTTELARFREDPNCAVMIANPAAAGEGVSLHHVCHHAVYLDRTFNAGQYLQSLDRIHRLGLPKEIETHITFLISRDTIDEVIDQRVRDKAARLGGMLDDPDIAAMALPDEEEYGPPVDHVDDVSALFKHLRGDPEGR